MLSTDVERLKGAILETQGNLTRAADLLECSKTHIMVLARRHQLNDWAREVRMKNGHPPTGNPLRSRVRLG